MTNTLGFTVDTTDDGNRRIVPTIDGAPLIDLVGTFESGRGYEPAGGYAGLSPYFLKTRDLAGYYLGAEKNGFTDRGAEWLLGCTCGELGCWPLRAHIDSTGDTVTWSGFGQPFRETWNYDGFGPFTFDRAQFDSAIDEARALVG